MPKESAFQQVGVNLFKWNDETIVMIGVSYSGSYPGGAVWKVDQEGAEKGTTSQLPQLQAWPMVIGQYLNLVQGDGLALGRGV